MSCKHCENSTGFYRYSARDKFVTAFKKEKEYKTGRLVSCPKCKNLYFYNSDISEKGMVVLNKVLKNDFPKIEKWNNEKYYPTKEQLKILKEIGATPPDLYGNGSNSVRFPCKVVLKNKKVLDYCIISFHNYPPLKLLMDNYKKYYFLNEVEEIKASEFALSREVRFATTRSEELRMSFAPTMVVGKDKKKYYINWTQNFIDFEGWKGKEITLPTKKSKITPEADMIPYYKEEILIIGDWKKDLEKLWIIE